MSSITTVERLESARKEAPEWQARISSVVDELHGRGIYLNEEFWGCGIDQSTLLIDGHEKIWLPISCISQPGERVHEFAQKDNDAVRRVFGEFVRKELGKLQARLGSM